MQKIGIAAVPGQITEIEPVMPKARIPHNETERLHALRQCCVLDSDSEGAFDDLTRLAAKACETPIALVSLVDSERQWFKSVCGLTIAETHRDLAICAHAILGDGPLVISNTTLDVRTMDNLLVTGPPHIQFYAGIPLRTHDGFTLGTLCVIDTKPRELSVEQLADLQSFANQATGQLELRRANRQLAEEKQQIIADHERLVQIEAQVPGVVYQFMLRPDGSSCFPYASEGIREVYRVSPDEVRTDATPVFAILHPDDYNNIVASIHESARSLQPWRHEYRIRFPDGETRWLFGNAMPTAQSDGSVLWHGFISDITKQRIERDESQKVRARLQAVVDASTEVAIVATDLTGVITIFNTGAEQMLGYTAKEMVGRQTPKIIHLESEVIARGEQLTRETGRPIRGFDAFVEYARQGRHDTREWTYVRKDGTHLTVKLVVTSVRDDENTLTGFLGVAIDITASRRIERELQTERERLDLALKGGELGTWDWNVQTGAELFDARWATIIGEPIENLKPRFEEWSSRVHADDQLGVTRKVQEHFAGRTPIYQAEFRLRHADGTWRWVVARGRVVERDQRGDPLRMVGTLADITEQVRAKEALVESESRFRSLAAFVPIGIYQTDSQGRCVYTNENWQQISGLTNEECLGDGWTRGIHPDDRLSVTKAWQKFAASGGRFDREFRWLRPDGDVRHVRSQARPVLSDDQVCVGFVGCNEDITEQKWTESQLREKNDWFKVLTDAMPQLSWTCLPDGQCDYLSKQWITYTGIPEHFQLGYGWLEQLHPDDREAASESWKNHVVKGLAFDTQFRIRGSDGDYRWYHTRAVPIQDTTGRIVKWLGSNTDIQAIRTSDERYELAVRGSNAALWDWNIRTGELFTSPRFKQMLGYNDEEFPKSFLSFIEILHPEDRDKVQQALEAHFAEPQHPYDMEYRLRTKSGEYRFTQAHGVVVYDEQGEPCRMVGSNTDIHDRKLAEACLKQREQAYRVLFDSVPAAVFVCDGSGILQHFNRRAAELWGREPVLGVEKYCGSVKLYRPDGTVVPHEKNPVMKVIRTGNPVRGIEVVFERPDGSFLPVIVNFDVTRDIEGEIDGCIVCFDDISQRKKAEDEMFAARETAEAANRSKSDFLANMSHEIRTPLTSILGYADLLSKEMLTDDQRDSYVGTIKRSGDHLLAIINDILDLSKIEAGKMTVERISFAPAEIVNEVSNYFQEQLVSKNLTLTVETLGLVPRTIASDPVRVRQILVNLIGNAVKFTLHGGIRVVVRMIPGDDNFSSKLAFDICDTGIGISEEQLGLLFAPFAQADTSTTREFGGTGLGLMICRRMARLLDGDIFVKSIPGSGSTFTATVATGSLDGIDLIDRFDDSEAEELEPTTPIHLSGRILLAEDSPVNQHLIRTLLTRAGAFVDVVSNGRQAVAKVFGERIDIEKSATISAFDPYDLILMDMQMPELDGCGATKEIRSSGFNNPIVAITANAMQEDRIKCLSVGFNDVITKPIDFDRLLETCHHWMSGLPLPQQVPSKSEVADVNSLIDQSALFRLVDHDLSLLEEVVQIFQEDSSALMVRARAELETGDLHRVAATAHRLKGSISVVQAESAYHVARSLEMAAYSDDWDGVERHLADLSNELQRLNPVLTDLLKSPLSAELTKTIDTARGHE